MSRHEANGELHSVPKAGIKLNKSDKAMRGFIARGGVGVVRIGKKVYVPQSEIDRLISDGFTPASAR